MYTLLQTLQPGHTLSYLAASPFLSTADREPFSYRTVDFEGEGTLSGMLLNGA